MGTDELLMNARGDDLLFVWYEDMCMINGKNLGEKVWGGEQKQALFLLLAFFLLFFLSLFLFL